MQIFLTAARQLLLDRLELEQQVVPEHADQRQPAVFRIPELFGDRAENRKDRGLFGPFFFREEGRHRLQPTGERCFALS